MANRPIKFRLIKDGKVVGYEQRLFDVPSGTIDIHHSPNPQEPGPNIVAVEDAYIYHDGEEEFTGMVDKAGVEIYENDNITFWGGLQGKVFYDKQQAGWGVRSEGNRFSLGVVDNIEVIGRSSK